MIKENKKTILADLSLLLVAFFWGGGFVAVKDAVNIVPPFYMITIRFGVSSLALSFIFWNNFKKVKKEEIKTGIFVGIVLFLSFSAQTMGAKFTTAGKQAFLTGTNVVIVPFLSWAFYGTKIDMNSILASILCLLGVGLLTLKEGAPINIGDILTLISAIFFAMHITLLGRYAKECNTINLAIIQMATASIISLIFALIFEIYPKTISKTTYTSMLYIIVFSTMFAFLIQTIAQKYTTPNHASVILCLEAVFGSLLAVIFLEDIFTLNMIIGCILIFIGIIIAETEIGLKKMRKLR